MLLYNFEMREIEQLHDQDEEFNEEGPLNQQEKEPRANGHFILHDDFNAELDDALMDMDDIKAASKDPIQKVFAMDHDFVCISKQTDESYEDEFKRGLDFYMTGDWHPAKNAFQFCETKMILGEV